MAERTVKLNSGYEIPVLGYGTWQSRDPAKLKVGLKTAIEAGYCHIDTAHIYGNEGVIGDFLQECYESKLLKREDMFLTTKVFPSRLRPDLVMPCLKGELAQLKTSYVDLYLIHFPVAFKAPTEEGEFVKKDAAGNIEFDFETKLEDTWSAMEKCVEAGLTRSIGVSNCNIKQVERLLRSGRIKPAMNQIESHPAFQNTKLIEFCQENGIGVTAYSQFGSPGTIMRATGKIWCDQNYLEDERIVGIGKQYGKSAAQVILRWQIQRRVIVIPKSVTPSRIVENFDVWDFSLSDEDMKAMAAMDLNKRYQWLFFPGIKEHPEYPHLEEGSC